MMSSTKPEVHKGLTYRNAVRGGPCHSHKQHAQKLVKFDHAVLELCKRTDRQNKPIDWRANRQTNKQTYSSQYFQHHKNNRLKKGQKQGSTCPSCRLVGGRFT